MSIVIPNCLKYDSNDPSICLECDHFLHFGRITKRCECESGSGITCEPGFSCSDETHMCIPMNSCLQINNCQECVYVNHSNCYSCAKGYFVAPDKKSCISLETCNNIDKCKECSVSNPQQCAVCQDFMSISKDQKICECGEGSGKQCPNGYICTLSTGECVKKYACRTDISHCHLCVFEDERQCFACDDGYSLQNGQCNKLDDCFINSPYCAQCDPNKPTTCLRCKNGLTVGQDLLTCECTLGSKLVCHNDQVCTKHYHICVEQQACLSFPSIIQGCLDCNFYDPRFCHKCENDLVLSADKLRCISKNTCKLIKGCDECNAIQPNLCFKCGSGLILNSDGMQCYCGQEGSICKNGTKCIKDSCQSSILNKATVGQIAGILIVVLALISVIISLVVFIIIQKKKSNTPKKDLQAQTSFTRSQI